MASSIFRWQRQCPALATARLRYQDHLPLPGALRRSGQIPDGGAPKGALETFTIGLAKEVAREGIRVNCIRPGHIYTEMHASGGEPGRVDRVRDTIPMGRGGQPEEVARAILWLASAEASFSTGTFLDATGGK